MQRGIVAISLCAVLTAGVVAAPAASASPVDCTGQLVADLQNAPVPDPTTIVVIEELNVTIDTTGTNAFIAHIRGAATRFAECVTPNPDEILTCIDGVIAAIVDDMTRHTPDDEIYLRYVHLRPNGVTLNGNYAAGDALAIAACA